MSLLKRWIQCWKISSYAGLRRLLLWMHIKRKNTNRIVFATKTLSHARKILISLELSSNLVPRDLWQKKKKEKFYGEWCSWKWRILTIKSLLGTDIHKSWLWHNGKQYKTKMRSSLFLGTHRTKSVPQKPLEHERKWYQQTWQSYPTESLQVVICAGKAYSTS